MKQGAGDASLYISFVGDSFMRNTWRGLFLVIAREAAVRELVPSYQRDTYHKDHLFCCSTDEAMQLVALNKTGAALRALGNNCTVKYSHFCTTGDNPTECNRSLADVQAQWHRSGAVCASWVLQPTFKHRMASHLGKHYRNAPNLWVVNGGLHYTLSQTNSTRFQPGRRAFKADLTNFLSAMRQNLKAAPRAALALIGTTRSLYPDWKSTVAANDFARSLVAELSASVGGRASYIDLPGLVQADDCGMPHNFPFVCMEPANGTDACGNRVIPKDVHFPEAAYLHLAEILLHMLWLNRPICPPAGRVESDEHRARSRCGGGTLG